MFDINLTPRMLADCIKLLVELRDNGFKNIDRTGDERMKPLLTYLKVFMDRKKHGMPEREGSLKELDYMISPIVKMLNNRGIETVFSCDGHFNRTMYIMIKGFIDPEHLYRETAFTPINHHYFTNNSHVDMTVLGVNMYGYELSMQFKRIAKFTEFLERFEFKFVDRDVIVNSGCVYDDIPNNKRFKRGVNHEYRNN